MQATLKTEVAAMTAMMSQRGNASVQRARKLTVSERKRLAAASRRATVQRVWTA